MNRQYLQDIVKGKYGRKVAYVDEEQVTTENILSILAQTVGIFNKNMIVAKYLWDYKNGDQPILYRKKIVRDDIVNKVVENHAYEIVQFNVSQTYGEPIQYVCTREDDSINKSVDKLNDLMKNAFKFQRNVTQGEWKSAVGTSFLAVQRTWKNNNPFRITVPTPLNTYIVYSSRTGEPLLAVQRLKDEKQEQYFLCFSETHEFRVKDGKLLEFQNEDRVEKSRLHVFGGIPIVEIPNNQDRISDIEIVITLLDSINNMQSNRMDAIEQFVQSWIKFVNCEVDMKTFEQMKMEGALVVKSNNADNKADVDVMTQELNQTESQVAKDDLWNNALSILAIPNKQGNTGGDTQGAVELRNGWDFAKNRAKLKDAYVIEAETRLVDVVLNVLRIAGYNLNLSTMDFNVNIPHSPQDNLIVKCQALEYLLKNGIHPLIALKTSGLWSDSEKVYLMSQPYLDYICKTVESKIKELPNSEKQIKEAESLLKNQEATTE